MYHEAFGLEDKQRFTARFQEEQTALPHIYLKLTPLRPAVLLILPY